MLPPVNYDTLRINNTRTTNSVANIYDYVWVKNGVQSQDVIDAVNNFFYIPTFDFDTLLLANFNDNINGGNISNMYVSSFSCRNNGNDICFYMS